MNLKLKDSAIFVLCYFLMNSCVSPPSYDIVPEIAFLSLSRDLIDQRDSIRIEFTFTDGDGDLGFENPDSITCTGCDSSCYEDSKYNFYVADSRTGCLYQFRGIPYIPTKGSSDDISGKVDFLIVNIICIPPDGRVCSPCPEYPYDTVIYTIQIKDVAGHFSNKIELPPVVIRCN